MTIDLEDIFVTPHNPNNLPDKQYLTTDIATTTVIKFQDTSQFIVIKTSPTEDSYYNRGEVKHKIVNDEGQEYENALVLKINRSLEDIAFKHIEKDDIEIISKPENSKKLANCLYALDEIYFNSLGAVHANKWPTHRRF